MKNTKKINCLLPALVLTVLLAGCSQTVEVKEDGDGYNTGYEKGYSEGYAAGLTGTETDSAAETALYPFYESGQVRITVDPVREDSTYTHLLFHAVNLTGEDMYLELSGLALNGYTMETSASESLPADGTAWITVSVAKEDAKLVENLGTVGHVKALFHLYDAEYDCIESILSETSFSEDAADAAGREDGELLYGEDGIVIRYLGTGDDENGNKYCRMYVENSGSKAVYLQAEAGAIPAEEIGASYYQMVLPDTKAVGKMYLYTQDYMKTVDPGTTSYASVLFSITDAEDYGSSKITDPLKLTLGENSRYRISEDGKELTVTETDYIYDGMEWLAESSDENVLTVDSVEVLDADDGMTQMCVVTCKPVAEGEAIVHIYYHPAGESLEWTEDFYPSLYVDRELVFAVGEDGTVKPGEVTLAADSYEDGTPVTYSYRLDQDGNMVHKFTVEE